MGLSWLGMAKSLRACLAAAHGRLDQALAAWSEWKDARVLVKRLA